MKKELKIHLWQCYDDNCWEACFYTDCWLTECKNWIPEITDNYFEATCKRCLKSSIRNISGLAKYADEHEII